MKQGIIILLLSLFGITANSQVLRGTVLEQSTDKVIALASIYFNGTYFGTSSDEKGHFELNLAGNYNKPITVSAVGYYSETITEYSIEHKNIIYLKPKVYNVDGVTIASKLSRKDKLLRARNEKLFKNEFLGRSYNASKCEILNIKDIRLNYSEKEKSLQAYSDKPIFIYNKALGYHITYFLDKFVLTKDSLIYQGNVFFNEDSINATNLSKILKKRKIAYMGSRMHFFRSLWENNLAKEGYLVRDNNREELNYKDIVIEKDTITKLIKFDKYISIIYKIDEFSRMYLLKNSILFDKDGYFDPKGNYWTGIMSNQRIGDLLPFEYNVGSKNR